MSVSIYKNNECRYNIDKLEKVVYLISADALRKIHIDDGEAYVDQIVQEPLSLAVYDIVLSDTDELDERYKFTHTLTFSMNGYANYRDFEGRYYAIVKTIDGVYWLVNPMFPCKVTYTYTLDANGSHTDFTLATISNHPTLRVHGLNHATPYVCGYRHCKFDTLRLNEKKFSLIDGDTIKYSNDGFKDVVYNKNSASLTEQFDGKNIQHTITFNIKFDDYKSSWHYNLLEFTNNLYAAIITTTCDKYILTGFHFGLRPAFTVTANDDFTMDNIQIQLVDSHDNGDTIGYVNEINEQEQTGYTYVFTSENGGFECIGQGKARYILKKQIDVFGYDTGNYLALVGYQDKFPELNIVGTFSETEEFYTSLCGDTCKFQSSFPSSFIFNTVSCRDYSVLSEDAWTITSSAPHITVSPTYGEANTTYTVRVCNTLTPTDTPVTSQLLLSYCNGQNRTYEVIVSKGNSCFPTGQVYDISANGQYVTAPTSCCVQSVVDTGGVITNIVIQSNYIKVWVPQNDTGSARQFILRVTFCDGTIADITINQGVGFERWVKESETCVGNQKCDVERKYTGTTASDINTRTNETRTTNCVVSSECSGSNTRWIDTTDTTCSGGKKYYIQAEQISTDGGQTWTLTGNKRLGSETSDSPAECEGTETYEDWRTDGWVCDGTTKYERERLYTSTDNTNWIATNTYRRTSTVLETNSVDCGYTPGSDEWSCEKWEIADGYICEETTKYAREQRFVRNCADCNNCDTEWTATGVYRRTSTVLETNSVDCGYVKPSTAWTCTKWEVVQNDYICEDGTKYTKERKYVRDCEDCNDCSTPWNPTDVYRRGSTVLEENSADCGYNPSISGNCSEYRNEGNTICDGYDKYQYLRKYVRQCDDCSNCSASWQMTDIFKKGSLIQSNSIDCGYIPSETYVDWREDGYTCDGYAKYKRLRKYISEDNVNWYETEIFKKGDLIEAKSFDCGYIPTDNYYEWRIEGTMCDGFNKYNKERKYISDDGVRWYETDIYRQGSLIEGNSPDCGWTPRIQYEYQWTITTQTTCIGYDKYYLYKKQRRIKDTSDPWEDVIPTVYSYNGNGEETPQIAESQSRDCGYTPSTEPIYEWRVMDISTDWYCASCDSEPTDLPKLRYRIGDNPIQSATCDSTSAVTSADYSNSSGITYAMIGTCVSTIGDNAFKNKTLLTEVRIPDTVTSVGASAFEGCQGLVDFSLPNSVTTIGASAFKDCIQLNKICLSNDLEYLGVSAFEGCKNFPFMNIPPKLTQIPDRCFYDCDGMSDVIIPEHVTRIGSKAFAQCDGLVNITLYGLTPPLLASDAFKNVNSNFTIYVNPRVIDTYKSAVGWRDYADKIKSIGDW